MKKKLDKQVLSLTYNAVIKLIDKKTGKIKSQETLHNLIVTAGKTRVRDLIGGASSTGFTYIALGTGTTDPAVGNTALETEVKRASATVTYPASNQVKYEKVFTWGSAESYTVTEAGLFDSASSGTMLNRLEFAGKSVDIDTDLSVTITISIS